MLGYVGSVLVLLSAAVVAQPASTPPPVDDFKGRPRAIVLSDIGNEPDDQMSLVRLLLYSNEIDIEELIASTSTWQKKAVHPETMRTLIAAYGACVSLLLHAQGGPLPPIWMLASPPGRPVTAWPLPIPASLRKGRA